MENDCWAVAPAAYTSLDKFVEELEPRDVKSWIGRRQKSV